MPIIHDCTRQVEVISFIEEQQPTDRSGWFLDFFFRTRTTRAEKLELRRYMRQKAKPLFYSGACLPPNLIDAPEDAVSVQELTWPTIKAEGKITGCDVDERRITPEGDIIPVGMQRFNEALNWEMAGLIDGLRNTHIHEAITLLKTGGYILHSSETENMGVVDFGRAPELLNVDLTGTQEAWSDKCSYPMRNVAAIVRQMAKYQGAAGVIDIIHSELSWQALQAHEEMKSIDFREKPELSGLDVAEILNYNDITFMGTTNGGQFRHWQSMAEYCDHTGAEVPVLNAGEIMIVSRSSFDGQRVFRSITSDNKEELPAGANFFLYDDLEEEYNRKCRSFAPWLEEYHLMVPSNVNGAVVVQVVDPAYDPCPACETCP